VKRENHKQVVLYTDEGREIEDSFYHDNLDIEDEKKKIEKEADEDKKKNRELEERYKALLSKHQNEMLGDVGDFNDSNGRMGGKLEVKVHALMTDFSQPKGVEIIKNSNLEFKNL